MSNAGWFFCLFCLAAAVVIISMNYWNTRKIMKRLDEMIESAMDGTFREKDFDESMLSALETRFAHFLSASDLSASHIIQEKDRIKELIGDISHQTKTPISNLLLYTELLKEEKLSMQAEEYVSNIYDQADKLRFLIGALVKLSRLENGIIALHPKKDNLDFVIKQVEQQYLPQTIEKGLTLKVLSSDIEACFDRKWTVEALCNLVDNAIKYTDKGEIRISVIPYEMYVRVNIEDTGIGIPEEELSKIFSRFYRVDVKEQQEGVGIGLYLTREILKNQGGYIKVSSKVGKGSVFSVFLPVGDNYV